MSLLMEALKRAEQSKQKAEGNGARNPDRDSRLLELEPLQARPSSGDALPPVTDDGSLSAPARQERPAPPSTSGPRPEIPLSDDIALRQAKARDLLAAKKTPRVTLAFWSAIAVLLTMVAATGVYFWNQYQLISNKSLVRTSASDILRQTTHLPPPQPLPERISSPSPPPAVAPSAPSRPASSQAVPSSGVDAAPEQAAHPHVPESPKLPFSTGSAEEILPAAAPERILRPFLPVSNAPLRLSPSTPETGAMTEKAYNLLQAGQFDDARRGYERVLGYDPGNIDALLGLAVIAGKLGQSELAYAYYQRAFEIDPRDPTALAGMINERGLPDPAISESRIKTMLASQPESPALLFSLGNLYAAQGQWSDAQKAYFGAYSIAPDNADYIFNLAVSLDHLNRAELAVRYYNAALRIALGNSRVFSFDANQARNRILELTSSIDTRP
ncbi:MAG: tetratricopeptide repeat protein [Candidatus Accumulibacter sp.]|jgi:tetratricopeptide (TPR) repeat protein|nr:tetratricopeptide repeat protein [Accumulibacter sp.]